MKEGQAKEGFLDPREGQGKSGMCFPSIDWKEVPLQPEGEGGVNGLGQLCFLGGSHRNVEEDGPVGPSVSPVWREVMEDPPRVALRSTGDGAVA